MLAKRAELVAKVKGGERRGAGPDLASKVREGLVASPPGPEEVAALATLFNEQLSKLFPDREPADAWYHCLREFEGQIFFEDLKPVVRRKVRYGGLELSHAQLPEARLEALWLALDEKKTGHIGVGSFGRFIRFGSSSAAASVATTEGTPHTGAGGSARKWQGALRTQRLARDQQRARNARSSGVAAETAQRLTAATQKREAEAARAVQEAQRLEEQLRAFGPARSWQRSL
jgi:hypothetical protein